MDALKALMKDFDPAALMPDLGTFLGKLEGCIRLVVMLAPLVLLGLGLLYLLAAPKEANYKLGYRCFWGMSSVESWRFTQRLAGGLWTVLGLILAIVMYSLTGKFQGMGLAAVTQLAVKYLLWELGCVVVSMLIINLTVVVFFDFKGNYRPFALEFLSNILPKRRPRKNK